MISINNAELFYLICQSEIKVNFIDYKTPIHITEIKLLVNVINIGITTEITVTSNVMKHIIQNVINLHSLKIINIEDAL